MTAAPDKVELELPLAPRSLWDFIVILAPVIKYYAALVALFLGARYLTRQLENEARAQDQETQRPVLSPELTLESSEEEEETIEELTTDGDRLVSLDISKRPKKQTKNTVKELFDGLRKVEQELRDREAKEDADDSVSWNDLHSSMLRRYQDKYPNHGPRVADAETDKYNDEFNELLRKNNIEPNEFKSQNSNKTE